MRRWPQISGLVIGLTAGTFLLGLTGSGVRQLPEPGPILSECDGRLRELVIHYEPSAKGIALPVYAQFLASLESDVAVNVVCRDAAAYQELLSDLGTVRCTLRPVLVHHPITTWSRDRWVALAPSRKGNATTLWSPRGEAAEEIWPARAGDERVGRDIAVVSRKTILARRSSLYFDGGDFLADSENVFVIPRVLQRNLQHTVATKEELMKLLSAHLKRRVILLDEAPDHHAGMFMASVGNRTMLVGDPSLAKALAVELRQTSASVSDQPRLEQNPEGGILFPGLPGGADFSSQTQRLFDAVAAQCRGLGYRVIRVPTALAPDGRTYYTYLNALIDRQGSRRIVYVPSYHGVERMNLAAQRVWEGLGYEVRAVDCSSTYRHFGCLHCLVNVVRRDEPPSSSSHASLTRNRTVR